MEDIEARATSIELAVPVCRADIVEGAIAADIPGLELAAEADEGWWNCRIDLRTGRLLGWARQERGFTVFLKVKDGGLYTLFDADGVPLVRLSGYLPNDWGDYLELEIGADGLAARWPGEDGLGDFRDRPGSGGVLTYPNEDGAFVVDEPVPARPRPLDAAQRRRIRMAERRVEPMLPELRAVLHRLGSPLAASPPPVAVGPVEEVNAMLRRVHRVLSDLEDVPMQPHDSPLLLEASMLLGQIDGQVGAAERVVRVSKTLAYVLRHRPDSIGIELSPDGWVDLRVLLTALAKAGHDIVENDLYAVIDAPGKKRYEISDDRIRASQGHSVDVDLGLEPITPPDVLYHGTVDRLLESIRAEGLRPGNRTHVHLSADLETATTVGSRRGEPVVLTVDARRMHEDGHEFFRAANGVWLAAHVPPGYLD